MKFDRKKIIGVAIAVMAVLLIVIVGSLSRKQNSSQGEVTGQTGSQPEIVTREAPPKDIAVPSTSSVNLQEDVAKPKVVAPGSSRNNSSYRSFDIRMENDVVTPSTIIVYKGDTADINVAAVDKDYNFSQPDYGFNVLIKKGQTQKIQFGATAAGKFIFYCATCGGPEKGPHGYIIVANKE
ncbi:MAG: hypothetical protein A3B25_02385 [Candidatus Ryanbacteria bacterium RIFCSPLOWO2_01_FULL_48_26]|uniref:EfeO-type cupredoxin-like domain-containing protein n=1 Tax=Candidatus Ryanbacteria bacterium RIFCSPLOWO2_01_FULL_48_26 TaxID=1802126 RepID=A0A1G2GQN0_9BACT|nr:MAG: hypothetical protein A3B25_02385 [Candidatus Ryanbacteria bacterium RIFCSPLOWO2_01_FULL_48_26]